MKTGRQSAILRLIKERNIANQGELTTALATAGFNAAQSTVSRDIRELGLVLMRTQSGNRYVAPAVHNLDRQLRDSLITIKRAGYMLVLRTRSGMAMAVALAIDEMNFEEVLGCVAGDDTILCAVRTEAEAETLMESLAAHIA